MKASSGTALIAVISCLTSPAPGGIYVWHTAEALTPNASVTMQGSQFNRLDLFCDQTPGDCAWKITTQLRIEDGTSTAYNLYMRDPAGNSTTLSTSQTSIAGSPYNQLLNLIENGSNGLTHLISAKPPTFLPGSFTVHFMYSFVLTKQAEDVSGVMGLDIGTNCFGGIEPFDPGDPCRFVEIDGSPGAQGGFTWSGFDLIRITNVPEPGSLGLLACGLVLLRHRKRSRA